MPIWVSLMQLNGIVAYTKEINNYKKEKSILLFRHAKKRILKSIIITLKIMVQEEKCRFKRQK